MKTLFHGSMLAALLAVGTFGFAQDAKKDGSCCKNEVCCQDKQEKKDCWTAIHEQICPEKGKCTGKMKEACDHVADTVKAAGTVCMEKCKKAGMKCGDCEKAGKDAPCDKCHSMCVNTFVTYLKKQCSAKDPVHTKKGNDGKDVSVKCTLISGPACASCADEMSDAMIKACKEAMEHKKP